MYNSNWGDCLRKYNYDLLRQEVKTYEELRNFKHDFMNHANVLKLYLQMGMVDKSIEYIDKLVSFAGGAWQYKKITGNLEIDMLLSPKISKIYNLGCEIDISSNLSDDLSLNLFDIVSILGNLLDNCYDALVNTTEKRLSIDVNTIYDNLFIQISNTHSNNIIEYNDEIITSKHDNKNHGIGIKSIKNCVDKNHGQVLIEYDEKEFYTEIVIPLKDNINYSCYKKA